MNTNKYVWVIRCHHTNDQKNIFNNGIVFNNPHCAYKSFLQLLNDHNNKVNDELFVFDINSINKKIPQANENIYKKYFAVTKNNMLTCWIEKNKIYTSYNDYINDDE
jgi:hypothetical protein